MRGRNPTAEEKRYMAAVASMGCIVCRVHYGVETEAAIHHCDGKTKEGAHFDVLPLCGRHHQLACPDGSYATRHGSGKRAGKYEFEQAYGTEEWLKEKVAELL